MTGKQTCLILALAIGIGTSAPAEPSAADTLLAHGVREIVFAERSFGPDGHWYGNFGYYFDGPHNVVYGRDGRLLKLDVKTQKLTTLLEDRQGAIRDPQVHYDGQKILFSYRQGGTEQFHLYEINTDGTGLKQLTDGIFQLYLEGEKLGQPIDLYSSNVEPAEPMTLAPRTLAKGTHTLRIEAVGSNSDVDLPHKVGIHLFGLDYLVLNKK